jgi:hypothetical protein
MISVRTRTTWETEMERSSTVRSKADLEAMLAHGLAPITDNVEALIELGFTRSYPTAQSSYGAIAWDRRSITGIARRAPDCGA